MWNPLKVNSRDFFFINNLQHVYSFVQVFFLVYYKHVFLYCDAFVDDFFFDVLIVNFKKISYLDLLFSVTRGFWSGEAATRGDL